MKYPFSPLTLSILATFLLAPLAYSQSLRVSVMAKLDEGDRVANSKAEKEEEKSMEGEGKNKIRPPKIDIANVKLDLLLRAPGTEAVDGLTVKWWLAGRSGGETGLKLIADGTLEASIPAGQPLELSTDPVAMKYVGAYQQKKEKIEASGEKVTGYGVQVLQGETVVGSSYSTVDVQRLVETPKKE